MPFSPSQQKAIDIRDTNVIVAASAGSGKTSVLVERLCQLVLKDHISINSILAMTFTEDAANEMKERLLSNLKKEKPSDYINKQMALLETASICTIDSFCLSIVKNYYYKIPISYRMSNQVASSTQTKLAFNNAYKRACQDVKGYFDIKQYILAFGKKEEDIQKYVNDILNTYNAKSNGDAWLQEIIDSYSQPNKKFAYYFMTYFKNNIKAMMDILEIILSQISDPGDYEFKLEQLKKCYEANTYQELKEYFLIYFKTTIKVGKTIDDQDFKMLQEAYKKYETKILSHLFDENFYIQDMQNHLPIIQAFVELTKKVKQYFQEEKKEMEIIDFNDMEHFAYELLQDPMIQEEMRNKYNMILVDEFQDTNELQESIIASFCRKNNVFRVGDIKQSIYGFRQADPSIMLNWLKKEDENNTPLILQENYRSNASIIEFNNDFYSKIMNNPITGHMFDAIDYANVGTDGQKNSEQYPIRFLYTEYGNEEGNKIALKKSHKNYRFDLIAQDILKKHEKGVPYRDICILTRSNSPQKELKEVLEVYDIPAYVNIEQGFFNNPAIQIVVSTLSSINDPTDDIALCACLNSPLFSIDFIDLIEEENQSLFQSLKDKAFMHDYFDIYAQRNKPIVEILQYIYAYNNFYYDHTTIQDKSNLDYLLEIANQYPDPNDLSGFVDQLKNDIKEDATAEASMYGKEDDVVQIKTMHKSKGLQYPIVYILSSHEDKDNTAMNPCIVDSELGISLAGLSKDRKLKYASYHQLAMHTKKFISELAEEMRVFYVATTRSKQELVIVDYIDSLESYQFPLNTFTLMQNKSYTGWLLYTYAKETNPMIQFDRVYELYERPQLIRKANEKIDRKIYSNAVSSFTSTTASSTKRKLEWKPFTLQKNIGTLRGTLFHEIVAQCAFPYQEDEIKAFGERKGYSLNTYDIQQILRLNELKEYMDWMQYPHTFEESFIVQDQDELIHGFMDLVVYKPNEIIIVDYKTDHVNHENELIDRYTSQLKTYKKAMEMIESKPVRCAICSFCLNSCIFL